MDRAARRRPLVSTLLACLLAVESVTAVAAAAQVSIRQPAQADTSSDRIHEAVTEREPARTGGDARSGGAPAGVRLPGAGRTEADPVATAASVPARAPKPARPDAPPAPARAVSTSTAGGTGSSAYRGRNHVWIPALGIDRSVAAFPCSRSQPPGDAVYRWGCSGANNVYLLGHAYSVFKPLHDAYVRGRLRAGMKVWYADGTGRVRTYAVRWWKVVLPTPDAKWAWAAQSVPSMTLQTCVGANSEYRLMVRLTEVR